MYFKAANATYVLLKAATWAAWKLRRYLKGSQKENIELIWKQRIKCKI